LAASGLLALGFYFEYRRKATCDDDPACEARSQQGLRVKRAGLWVGALGVAAFAFLPGYVSVFMAQPVLAGAPLNGPSTLLFAVDGMSCEGCTVTVRNGLLKVPGVVDVQVIFEEKRAIVIADRLSLPAADTLSEAILKAGYKGEVLGVWTDSE